MKRGLSAPLMAIVAEGLLSRLSFGLVSFSLPLYARHLGLSLTEVGVLAALNSAVALGLKPMVGWAADRFGLKRTYLVAISVRSLVSLAFGFAVTPSQLFAIRSLHGLSTSLRDPSANALIAEHGGEKSVASAFAWYQTAKTVAGSLSRALAGILLSVTAANYSLVFLLAFALSVLPLLVVGRYVTEHQDATTPRERRGSSSMPGPSTENVECAASGLPVRPRMLPLVGLGFLMASTAEMLNGLFPVLATEYAGLSKAQAGVIYAVATLATIFSSPLFGWLSDSVSRKLVLAVRAVANTLASIIYVVFPTFAGVAVAKTTDDMGKAAFRPAWGSLMAEVSSFDKRNRARTMSWMSMGEDAGGVLSPILAGFLWGTWGIAALMGVRIVLALATELYVLLITGDPREENREGSGSPVRAVKRSHSYRLLAAVRALRGTSGIQLMQNQEAQEREPHSGDQALRCHPGVISSSSRMLTNYLADIEQLLAEHRWEAAMREASDLPQIAVALADPQLRSSTDRIKTWCGEWVRPVETERATRRLDYECVHRILCERLGHRDGAACESVPASALRRLRLHRLTRASPGGFASEHPAAADAQGADSLELCCALIEAARRWYANSACHDADVQANLARLAVLR